jgi:hypothetical protein
MMSNPFIITFYCYVIVSLGFYVVSPYGLDIIWVPRAKAPEG